MVFSAKNASDPTQSKRDSSFQAGAALARSETVLNGESFKKQSITRHASAPNAAKWLKSASNKSRWILGAYEDFGFSQPIKFSKSTNPNNMR